MKIYDFTYVNKLNLTETTLNDRVREFLVIERENQGWIPDFTFMQSSPPAKNISHTEYQFEVHGRFLTSGEDDQREISEKIMEHIRLSRLEKSYTFDNVISLHGHKN